MTQDHVSVASSPFCSISSVDGWFTVECRASCQPRLCLRPHPLRAAAASCQPRSRFTVIEVVGCGGAKQRAQPVRSPAARTAGERSSTVTTTTPAAPEDSFDSRSPKEPSELGPQRVGGAWAAQQTLRPSVTAVDAGHGGWASVSRASRRAARPGRSRRGRLRRMVRGARGTVARSAWRRVRRSRRARSRFGRRAPGRRAPEPPVRVGTHPGSTTSTGRPGHRRAKRERERHHVELAVAVRLHASIGAVVQSMSRMSCHRSGAFRC